MSNAVETFEVNGYTVEIIVDEDCEYANPRQDVNNGVMFAEGHARYTLGDADGNATDQVAYDRARDIIEDADPFDPTLIRQRLMDELGASVVLPLYLLDHSGLTMRTGPFAEDPGSWDSGIVGFIFDTPATREATGCEVDVMARALRNEVEAYGRYLSGDVYGYRVVNAEGDEVDSCWGFLGLDYATEAATEAAQEQEAPVWLAVLSSVTYGVTVYGTYTSKEDAEQDGSPLLLQPPPKRLYRLVVTPATAGKQYTVGTVMRFSLTHAEYLEFLAKGWQPANSGREFTARELSALPTIVVGYSANLKIDEGTRRVWLERTGVADGEQCDNKITVQQLTGDGQWVTAEEYPGGALD